MPVSRRVSERQLELLLTFAEASKDIALGRCTRGPQVSQITQRAWETVANKLNSVTDGVSKTAEQWRRYWVEWKAKTKAKGADNRRNAMRTGGGPNRLIPLTEFEKRILQLIGPVCVEGLPGVRIPFPVPSENTTPSSTQVSQTYTQPSTSHSQPSTSHSEPSTSHSQPSTSHSQLTASQTPTSDTDCPMEEEWLEDDDFDIEKLSTQPPSFQPPPSQPPLPTPSPPPPSSSPTQTAPSQQPPRDHHRSPSPQRPQSLPEMSSSPAQPDHPSQRPRSRQRLIRNSIVPQWARSLEERRLAIEEMHARALEALSDTLERRLANIEDRLREISDKLSK
ncbi:hypothetical protein ABMA27_010320 [Loxostege sticticalis]|uniref:Regulatory protein zeste n=1 Tax=Loxostege sticticalis TaxID=481309 RepID=A0ABR3H5C3_LOXSC